MTIGEKLRDLRQNMKKTLKEQSATFGVTINSIYRWEHNQAIPRTSVLKKMADYYGVPLEWLVHEDAEETRFDSTVVQYDDTNEKKLLQMYKKLSTVNKYKILGYVERIYIENLEESRAHNEMDT